MAAARYVDSDGDDETTLPPGSIYAPDDSATPQRTLWLATVLPFHYGYLILVACGIGLGMSGPGQTTTFGVLVGDEADPQSLMNETGVNRSSSSVLWMVATFGSAATMLRFGFWLDQLGPMKALAATAVLLGASLLLLSVCSSPAALFAGLYCLRLFGQGCMMLIPPYTVALWWVERRGFAYAITLSIGSIGINYGYPMLAKSVMEMPGYTWRDVLRCEALLCIVGTLPLGLLFYRSRPELYGLLPDGRGSKSREYRQICIDSGPSKARGAADKSNNAAAVLRKKQALKTAEADARSWTAHDALRTTSLWATCGGVCLIACISMGVWFHLVGMVTDATEGHIVTSAQLSRVLGVQTVGQMVAKFSFSWLLDRFSVRVVLLGAIVVQLLALGTFCLAIQLQLQLLALIAVGLQAAALGGAYSVDGVSYAKFFGRNSLGSITGATKACWQVATAIGPTPLGLVRDHTGTFVPALVVAFGVVLLYAKRPSIAEPRLLPCFRSQSRYDVLPSEESSKTDRHDDFECGINGGDSDDEHGGGERRAMLEKSAEAPVSNGANGEHEADGQELQRYARGNPAATK